LFRDPPNITGSVEDGRAQGRVHLLLCCVQFLSGEQWGSPIVAIEFPGIAQDGFVAVCPHIINDWPDKFFGSRKA
jgi:hypothetical protein